MSRIPKFCPECGSPLIQKLYEGQERPYCTSCGHTIYIDPKVAVVVFIVQDDKLLLIQRGMNPGKDKWALPAGFVDYDEAPEDAGIRETLEETHLHVKIDKLLAVYPKKDNGLADIIVAYSASILGGEIQAGDDASDVGWFTRDNLPELVFYPSITLTRLWRSNDLEL